MVAMPLSTVSMVLKRNGMGKLGRIGLDQPVRYERSRPGQSVEGQGIGRHRPWETKSTDKSFWDRF
jgi:hypothetical protein